MRKKKSAILEAVHETATGLHKAGVMDRVTLREFVGVASLKETRMCLSPVEPLEPEKSNKLEKHRMLVKRYLLQF
jgi:putative transcriptional regulator